MPGFLTVCCPDCGHLVDVAWTDPTVTHASGRGRLVVSVALGEPTHHCPDPTRDTKS